MDTGMEPIVPNINRILVIFGLADGDNSPGHGIGGGYIKAVAFWQIDQLRFSTSCTLCILRDRLVEFPRIGLIGMHNRRPL